MKGMFINLLNIGFSFPATTNDAAPNATTKTATYSTTTNANATNPAKSTGMLLEYFIKQNIFLCPFCNTKRNKITQIRETNINCYLNE